MKITYAKNSLQAALAAAPAQMAHTALVKAEDMLAKISDDCLARVDALIAEFPSTGGDEPGVILQRIEAAYETGRKMIGIGTIAGLPEIDAVASSLCDIADSLISRNQPVWEPIRVHVSTMELMRRTDLPPEARQQLQAGLLSLHARYVPAQPDTARADITAAAS